MYNKSECNFIFFNSINVIKFSFVHVFRSVESTNFILFLTFDYFGIIFYYLIILISLLLLLFYDRFAIIIFILSLHCVSLREKNIRFIYKISGIVTDSLLFCIHSSQRTSFVAMSYILWTGCVSEWEKRGACVEHTKIGSCDPATGVTVTRAVDRYARFSRCKGFPVFRRDSSVIFWPCEVQSFVHDNKRRKK